MRLPLRYLLLTLCLPLAACTGMPAGPWSQPPVQATVKAPVPEVLPPPVEPEAEDLSGELLYDILLGEVAGQRQRLDVSVDHYQRAAELSNDPRIAERALRIALFAKDEAAALAASRRWVELEPERLEARQSLAVLALHAGISDEAFEQFEYLLAAAKNESDAYQSITALLARSEDREVALALIAQLVQRHPESVQAHLAYSRLALHAENPELALKEVEQVLALQPNLPEALVLRAGIRVKTDQAELAQQELRTAIAAQPKNIDLHLAMGRLLLDLKDLPGATSEFKQVVKLQPDHADALYSLGLLALEQKQLKPAEKYFRKLLALGQREQESRYYLGRIEEQRGNAESALDWYGQVTEGDYWLEAQTHAAGLRADLGDLAGARRQLQSLRMREPRLAVRLYLVEGDILSKAGELQQAMELYNRVLVEAPNNHEILYARALLAEKMSDLDRAETDLRSIVAEDPNNYHAWNALGYTLADRTERLPEALEYIQKALALAPNEAAIIDSLGWVYFRMGNLEEAAAQLQRAYELSNGDAEVSAHLGEVLWQQGKRKEARALWNKARKADPDNQPLQKTMQRLLP